MEGGGGDQEMEGRGEAVIDASVAVKWFNFEEYWRLADELKMRHVRGSLILIAPSLLIFEVSNALRYSPELGVEDVRRAVNTLLSLQVKLHPPTGELMDEAIRLAYQYGITIYDAVYIALARLRDIPLYTADERLIRKTGLEHIHHIRELEGIHQ